jgi:2-(1,2-epoxy-1,2-dihydrophenyl)acetyl-CoA isomerase
MPYTCIKIEVQDEIATLTLNRPRKLNALNPTILHELIDALGKLNEDDGVKVLIMTGEGRAFCTGADLTEEAKATDKNQPGLSRAEHITPFVTLGRGILEMERFTKPIIAAVNGLAVGAGLSYALAADVRFASDKAQLAAIFIRRGLVPDAGASYFLTRLVGVSRAMELMWTGEMISAQEAERIGMVNHVVPHDQLMQAAREFALKLAKGPSLVVDMVKRMAYTAVKADSLFTQLGVEDYMQHVAAESQDVQEGIKAFQEKRTPNFKGK